MLFGFIVTAMALSSCRKQGCTDRSAENYDQDARKDNGTCRYRYGCMDSNAVNFDSAAQFSDHSCIFPGKAAFFLKEDVGCDTVTVALDNSTFGTVSRIFPSGAVACGQNGVLTFELDPGKYTYFVSGVDSCNWSGTMTVKSRECTPVGIVKP